MTQPVDSQTRRSTLDLFASTTNDPTASGPAGAAPARARALGAPAPATRDLDVDAIPTAPCDLGAFARNTMPRSPAISAADTTSPTVKPRTAVQASLDERMAAYSGPYTVGGQQVSVPPQFRMTGGYNDVAAGVREKDPDIPTDRLQTDHSAELTQIAARAGVDSGAFRDGRPTATQLVKVTQALIDAGKLPAGPDAATRIKTMQWQWGVGIDCTDYAVPAAVRAVGARASVALGTDYFSGDPNHNPALTKVSPESAVPGDVFCLKNPKAKQPGHRAVVYSRTACEDATRADIVNRFGFGAATFLRSDPVQVFEVDSSWGAGPDGSASGGVRRDTWLYNANTKEWAQISPSLANGAPVFIPSKTEGPYSENLQGVYRFRRAP